MKKKSLFALIIAFIFTFVVLAPTAHAGNVQRQRWEGIAIGLGAAIIGSAIFNQHRNDNYTQQIRTTYNSTPKHGDRQFGHYRPEYGPEPDHRYGPHRHHYSPKHHSRGYHKGHQHRGYWEVRKEWVPSTYKKVWNPGHYNRHGKWKAGHWIEIEDAPGYWTETRVWVARR